MTKHAKDFNLFDAALLFSALCHMAGVRAGKRW
jgi:hypothetical protein